MFKAYTKYVFVVFLLIASCGQSYARAQSFAHANSDCVMANSSLNTITNPGAHTTGRMSGEETGSMAMSTNDKMAMSDGNCCFDECMCDTSTCSNASLVAVARHPITALTYSEHVVAEQRGKPKSISSSLFRPPIIG